MTEAVEYLQGSEKQDLIKEKNCQNFTNNSQIIDEYFS